jgi:hypothetical protein
MASRHTGIPALANPFKPTDNTAAALVNGSSLPDITAALHADAFTPREGNSFTAFAPVAGMALSATEYTLPTAFTSMARALGSSPATSFFAHSEPLWASQGAFRKGLQVMEEPGAKFFTADGLLTPLGKQGAMGLAKGAGLALAAWGVEYSLDKTVFKNVPEGPVSSAVRWALVPFALNYENPLWGAGAAIAMDVGARLLDKVTNGKL